MSSTPRFAFAKLLADRKMTPPSSPKSYSITRQPQSDNQTVQKFGGLKQKVDYNDEKISDMLENYKEIPRSEWMNLPIGSHIRYVKKDNKFQPGGFIRTKNIKGDHSYFILENDKFSSKAKNPDYTSWPMNFENVIRVYVKDQNIGQSQPPPISQSFNQPPPISQSFNPNSTVEMGFVQKQLDDLEKKYSLLETNYKAIQEKIADLEIFSREVGKYMKSKT